jgi:hypothetical protein
MAVSVILRELAEYFVVWGSTIKSLVLTSTVNHTVKNRKTTFIIESKNNFGKSVNI